MLSSLTDSNIAAGPIEAWLRSIGKDVGKVLEIDSLFVSAMQDIQTEKHANAQQKLEPSKDLFSMEAGKDIQ